MPDNNSIILRSNPIDKILIIAGNFIRRRKKNKTSDKIILAICIICASTVFALAFVYIHQYPDKWQFATGLLVLAGVLYGTVSFGIFMPTRIISQKIDDVTDIKEQMEELNEEFYSLYNVTSRNLIECQLTEDEKRTASTLLDTSLEKLQKVYDKFYS